MEKPKDWPVVLAVCLALMAMGFAIVLIGVAATRPATKTLLNKTNHQWTTQQQ